MSKVEKLLSISSDSICEQVMSFESSSHLPRELRNLLQMRNGFLGFESALLILPSHASDEFPSLFDWNVADGWRRRYDHVPKDVVFFGMDAFASQFGISEKGVMRMEVETGEISNLGSTIEDWAGAILDDYSFHTGWNLAHDWQEQFGPLALGNRLVPRKPFVLGGDYSVENLIAVPLSAAIEKLSNLYLQVKNIQDGQVLTVKNWF